jgi:hypothetical protein
MRLRIGGFGMQETDRAIQVLRLGRRTAEFT